MFTLRSRKERNTASDQKMLFGTFSLFAIIVAIEGALAQNIPVVGSSGLAAVLFGLIAFGRDLQCKEWNRNPQY